MSVSAFDPEDLKEVLRGVAMMIRDDLKARIQVKLSGEVLQTRSGALLASLNSDADTDSDGVSIIITSNGVPYAGIQEYGGKIPAHDITASKAKALAFSLRGSQIFASKVRHPGSTITPKAYLGASLAEFRDKIKSGFKEGVLAELRRG